MVSGELGGERDKRTLPSQRVGAIRAGSDLVVLQARDAIAKHDIRQFAVLPWRSPLRGVILGGVSVGWQPWAWQLAGVGSQTSHWNKRSPPPRKKKSFKARTNREEPQHHQFMNSSTPPLSSVTQVIDHLGLSQPPSRGSPLFSPILEDLWTWDRPHVRVSHRSRCSPPHFPRLPQSRLHRDLVRLCRQTRHSAMRPNCGSFTNSMCSARRPTCIAGLMQLFGLQRGIAVTGGSAAMEGRPR